jgi:hypothetical protein
MREYEVTRLTTKKTQQSANQEEDRSAELRFQMRPELSRLEPSHLSFVKIGAALTQIPCGAGCLRCPQDQQRGELESSG